MTIFKSRWLGLLAASLSLTSCADDVSPVAGHLEGNKPVGLFFMVTDSYGKTDRPYPASYFFAPGGYLYENADGLGLDGKMDTPAENYGTYTASDTALTVGWIRHPHDYDYDKAPISIQNGGFTWGPGRFLLPGGSFTSSSQLVGSFAGVDAKKYEPLVSKTFVFRPDSTYASRTDTAATLDVDKVIKASSTTRQAGRWKLKGWYLTLTDTQGHATRDIAYPVGDGKNVRYFSFNGVVYKRQ